MAMGAKSTKTGRERSPSADTLLWERKPWSGLDSRAWAVQEFQRHINPESQRSSAGSVAVGSSAEYKTNALGGGRWKQVESLRTVTETTLPRSRARAQESRAWGVTPVGKVVSITVLTGSPAAGMFVTNRPGRDLRHAEATGSGGLARRSGLVCGRPARRPTFLVASAKEELCKQRELSSWRSCSWWRYSRSYRLPESKRKMPSRVGVLVTSRVKGFAPTTSGTCGRDAGTTSYVVAAWSSVGQRSGVAHSLWI